MRWAHSVSDKDNIDDLLAFAEWLDKEATGTSALYRPGVMKDNKDKRVHSMIGSNNQFLKWSWYYLSTELCRKKCLNGKAQNRYY